MTNSEHLQFIHDRLVNHYNESYNVDFLIKLRKIIIEEKELEKGFNKYLEFVENKKKIINSLKELEDKFNEHYDETCDEEAEHQSLVDDGFLLEE